MDLKLASDRLKSCLGLTSAPVAVSFLAEPPAGVERAPEGQPAGCGYWRVAGKEERTFYTLAEDHLECPIGAHTHGVRLPAQDAEQLQGVLGMMFDLGYVRPEEVPAIPQREEPFSVAVYAPLADSPVPPDVVLVRGSARQIMLLFEAAQAAELVCDQPTMGRPTCAILPQAIQGGAVSLSLGCIGNRVYTLLPDSDFYAAIPGPSLEQLLDKLEPIVHANNELERYHRQKAEASA